MSSTHGDDFPATSDEVPEADALEQARPVTDEPDEWPPVTPTDDGPIESVTSADDERIESADPDEYDWTRGAEDEEDEIDQ